ncbi:MAG TPA: SDR family oxidoreductase [Alphaproteobacteria bacterium]|nr:SDR family oxidoreductase [Alphaproteobacteria bacterium]
MGRLDGKHAVITGGTTGIGLATAKLFQAEGARVAIVGRNPENLKNAAETLGPDCLPIQGDMSKLAEIEAMASTVAEAFPRVDIVFANAGITAFAAIEEADEALYDQVMDLNVKGVYFTVKHLLGQMGEGGAIILTTSVRGRTGSAKSSIYGASKAAVAGLARMLGVELAPRGIRVNALCPGAVVTPIYGRLGWSDERIAAIRERISGQVPMGRVGGADEIARVALFLASEDSSYMLGEEVVVDGGYVVA